MNLNALKHIYVLLINERKILTDKNFPIEEVNDYIAQVDLAMETAYADKAKVS